MAKSKDIKKWITINGNHVPVYEDGSLGGIGAKLSGKKAGRGPRPTEKGSKQDRMHLIIKEVQSKYGDDDDGFAEEIRNQIIEDNGEDLSDDEIRELAAQYYDEEDEDWQDRDYDEYEDEDDPDVIARNNEEFKKELAKNSSKQYPADKMAESEEKQDEAKKIYDEGSFEAELEERSDPEYKNVTEGVKSNRQMKAESESKSTSQSKGYEEFGNDIGTRISFGSDENGENDKVGKIESFSEDGKIATVRTNDGKAYHINSDGEIIDEVKPVKSNDSLKSYPGVKNFGNGPDGYEYGKYMDAIKESNDFEYKTVAGKDMPAIIDSLEEGDSLTVHHDGLRGIGSYSRYTKTKDGIEYATSSSFLAGKTLSEDEAKHDVKNSVDDNVITITRPKKSIKADEQVKTSESKEQLGKYDKYKQGRAYNNAKEVNVNGNTYKVWSDQDYKGTFAEDSNGNVLPISGSGYLSNELSQRKAIANKFGEPTFRSKSIKVGDNEVGVSKSKEAQKIEKVVTNARRQLDFDRPGDYAEIADGTWRKTLGVSNERMAEMMSAQDPKYDYEYQKEPETRKAFGSTITIEHHRMYRVPKGESNLSNMSASQIQDLISNIRSGDSQSKYSISELQAELRKRKK